MIKILKINVNNRILTLIEDDLILLFIEQTKLALRIGSSVDIQVRYIRLVVYESVHENKIEDHVGQQCYILT